MTRGHTEERRGWFCFVRRSSLTGQTLDGLNGSLGPRRRIEVSVRNHQTYGATESATQHVSVQGLGRAND
jgi:hypothetical protein